MKHSVKVIMSIVLLTAVIIVVSAITQKVLFTTSGELEKYLAGVENDTVSGSWENADKSLKKVKEKWAGTKDIWAILIDHQEIDNIDVTLSRMEKFILSKDTSSALAEASALMKYVRHIPRKEALSIENIF